MAVGEGRVGGAGQDQTQTSGHWLVGRPGTRGAEPARVRDARPVGLPSTEGAAGWGWAGDGLGTRQGGVGVTLVCDQVAGPGASK